MHLLPLNKIQTHVQRFLILTKIMKNFISFSMFYWRQLEHFNILFYKYKHSQIEDKLKIILIIRINKYWEKSSFNYGFGSINLIWNSQSSNAFILNNKSINYILKLISPGFYSFFILYIYQLNFHIFEYNLDILIYIKKFLLIN